MKEPKGRAVASKKDRAVALDAYQDFILSRKAMMVAPGTLKLYRGTIEVFIKWLAAQGKEYADEITPRDVRAYLNTYIERGCKPNYVNIHARNIRTFVKFLAAEEYIPKEVKFEMPPKTKERLLCLDADGLKRVLDACRTPRDKAMIMLMADSGLRAAEVLSLNWGNIDLNTGIIFLPRGKGGNPRSTKVGAKTCRAVLAYRRTVKHGDTDPLIQTYTGNRLEYAGLRMTMVRLSERSGERVTAHALRRTFATLALRAGMDALHLKGLLGHATLEMTTIYTRMVEDDLIQAHRDHGPLDKLLK